MEQELLEYENMFLGKEIKDAAMNVYWTVKFAEIVPKIKRTLISTP